MKPDHNGGAIRSTESPNPSGHRRPGRPILRFLSAERSLHWALAIPFVLLYATALGMLLFYAEPAPRHVRTVFSWLHRGVGVFLILLPPLALLANPRGWRMHLANMKEAWSWRRDDVRWLILFPRAAANPRVVLPEQGKFNAAEKLNFMMVSVTYPFYILTGILVWMPGVAIVPYLAHLTVAVMGLPLVAGHIFMATVNPDTRVGLSGMVTGWVDREWARHHYRRWFREQIEGPERRRAVRELAAHLAKPSRIKCTACEEIAEVGSWRELLERSFQVNPLFCPACEAPLVVVQGESKLDPGGAIVRHLEIHGADKPFAPEEIEAA